ncbi:MAG: ABC transporter ATP-binding protein [Caldilineales bacterium]|nr:ABC transporter ATP-binding protein [Caldilineales bacterium]MDW8318661.1 ABC transporter ATP-binding protein [Anaerolineae bacterium]
MAGVTLDHVSKRYHTLTADGRPVTGLDDVSLHIADGEAVSVVGPSGCGKSTLLKVIAGLEMPDAGRVLFNDVDVTRWPAQARGVGMVFQDYALYPAREGEDNLSYYFEVRKRTEEEKVRRVREVATLMGIGFDLLLERQVDTLSGGEKQRVGIARCIVRDPNVFLMDEPISNLDAKLRERTRIEIKRLIKAFGITTVYVTHDQQEAVFMGDRIAVMRAGRIEQFGAFDDLYFSPANLFVATLIGTPPMSVLPAVRRAETLELAGASLPLPPDLAAELPAGPLRLGVRPEGWLLDPPGAALTLPIRHVERIYTERAAYAAGDLAGSPVHVLVPLDLPAQAALRIAPDWERSFFFAAEGEAALRVPGPPDLF